MNLIYLNDKPRWKRLICKIKGHTVMLRFGNCGECTRCGLAPIKCIFVERSTKSKLIG